MKRVKPALLIEKTYAWILLIVFGGIVLQGPISVGLGTVFPQFDLLIKSWKEILIGIGVVVALKALYTNQHPSLLKDPLILIALAYILLHVIVALFSYQTFNATISGLMIDLRYVVYFMLVYLFLRLYPAYRKQFLLVFMLGGIIVVGFAILQVFLLPADILKYLGYSKDTIMPYLTVDQNAGYIRINSTLRGPNPLGAYAVIILAFIGTALIKRKLPPTRSSKIMAVILVIGGGVALWASYSRSALIAALVAGAVIGLGVVSARIPRKVWITGIIILFAIIGGLALSWKTPFVSQVLLHEDPTRSNLVSSNDGHVASLEQGVDRFAHQPLGAGIGSTGSPSLFTTTPLIIENHYLYVAHEAGWIGLALFIILFGMIIVKLWQARVSYVALGVCASGVGLAVIGLLLPVWADDTVALIWWGLAAVALTGEKKK